MTGPKLNEGALLIDETQVATKATARYLRGSASKARQVLDLIRGLDVRRADEVLQFTDRAAAQDVRKVLASAVANAVHNDNQDADELFVLACFADEGPTLKRFRPRARGRASRIRKRTSHITVIVARMTDARIEIVQARQAKSSTVGGRRVGTTASSRRDRVARSRARAESLRGGTAVEEGAEATEDDTLVQDDAVVDGALEDADVSDVADDTVADDTVADDTVADDTVADDTVADDTVVADVADDTVAEEAPEVAVQGSADLSDGGDDEVDTASSAASTDASQRADESDETAVDLPAGAVAAPDDGSIPSGHEIKGNASSKKFHTPGGRYYDITVAELFFDSVESAEAAGYEAPAADASKIEEDNE